MVAAVLLGGCVGPSRTDRDYGEKAEGTAKAMNSAVSAALVGVETVTRNHAYQPALSVLLGEAERDAANAQQTFDVVQPPSIRADQIHDELAPLLTQAADTLRALRIAVRRGALSRLAAIAAPLQHLADLLQTFAEAHT